MRSVVVLWDSSYLWGLLVWQALEAFGLPYQFVTAEKIAHSGLSDKTSLLIVPGGTARHKALALGENGRKNIFQWIQSGGHYLGFCGGSGLGLTEANPQHSLGLCPWKRAELEDRLQHMLSGHISVSLNKEHILIPFDIDTITIPVWWPGHFAVPEESFGVEILASYIVPSLKSCAKDLCVIDLPLSLFSEAIVEAWVHVYGVDILPSFLKNQPCVIHSPKGKGSYTLSYSHLETPGSFEANYWLSHILEIHTGLKVKATCVPEWKPSEAPILWHDTVLVFARSKMKELLQLAMDHGLFFYRTSWLVGWKAGIPGMALNNVYMALCVLTSKVPHQSSLVFWEKHRLEFMKVFDMFWKGVEETLLTQRLAASIPHAVSIDMLVQQKTTLFGIAMQGGGLYNDLLFILDQLLFRQLNEGILDG